MVLDNMASTLSGLELEVGFCIAATVTVAAIIIINYCNKNTSFYRLPYCIEAIHVAVSILLLLPV